MSKPYRTLFVGFLRQDADLSVGGSHVEGATDQPFSRDGRGWPTITGATLKGALVATARKIYPNLPSCISGDASRDEGTPHKSLWRLFTTHPEKLSIPPSPRQGVGIRQDTGAAAEHLLYDVEVLPRGTRWWFCLEVDTSQEEGKSQERDKSPKVVTNGKPMGLVAERIALDALQEWQRGRCWIGRGVARGMGWMTLEEKLQIYRLTTDHIMAWPDSRKTPRDCIKENIEENIFQLTDEIASAKDPNLPLPIKKPWHYLELEGAIEVGERPPVNGKTYGIDVLAVGGHSTQQFATTWDDAHYLKPRGRQAAPTADPHKTIAWSRYSDGRLQPYIPGSSLRGPMRHASSRLLRAREETIRDPNVTEPRRGLPDRIEQLFGTVANSSPLLIRDAYLAENSDWKAVWLERHAGDEFAGGVYTNSKFNQVALIEGKFCWKLVIEAADKATLLRYYKELLKPVLQRAAQGHLGLGGDQWQGMGWPHWKIDKYRLWCAGEEKPDEEPLCSE